ncbi:MAG TPA: TldD/PmbA family protein [Patescibacteria group bacterium]|nr:TldD/PmbA family protein [Patescibacteria group bacterium]
MMPDRRDIQSAIEYVVSRGAEFAEFYFERSIIHEISCEDRRVERISSGCDSGFGLRVMTGFRTAYGYSNIMNRDELFRLGREVTAELRAGGGGTVTLGEARRGTTGGIAEPADTVSIDAKAALVLEADRAARGAGDEISQVQVNYGDSLKRIWIFNSEGDAVEDERRQVLFTVRAIAREGGDLQTAYRAVGGRKGFEFIRDVDHERLAAETGASAITVLRARRAPAGTMTVVLGSQAGGTMTHEAIGHGLEGDAAEKGLSIYSGRVGEMIASPLVTVIDDATLDGKRGSYIFDDEGIEAQRTITVENGVLRGWLLDRLAAAKLRLDSTGNGRRQSYRFRPIVRMSNTFIAPGEHDPTEIVAGVKEGLYVARMGGGQVDTSTGDFVFKVNEAYRIQGGKITEPVRGATLIGNGPKILGEIDMVGNDLGFDIGTCGKDGQLVPVADAQPTVRIPAITVGGEV